MCRCVLARPIDHSMNITAISLLAFAMSTDAFAAAIGKGTALLKPRWTEALRTGAIFGVIEAITPVVGWALGSAASDYVKAWDHWIAFTLLMLLGGLMLRGAFRPEKETQDKPRRHGFWLLVATGFATSIDAMAVGIGLAFLDVNIVTVALCIGLATFTMVTLGVMLGRVLGNVVGSWAEGLGGLLLMGVGTLILLEHLSVS